MRRMRKSAACFCFPVLLLCLWIPSSWGQAVEESSDEGRVLSVSDIHFNPFQEDALVPKLIQSGVPAWHRIFEKSREKKPGSPGEDTNYALLISALKRMKKVCPTPDFILFSGDTLVHEFEKKFKKHSQSQGELRKFVLKTYEFISYEFNYFFPRVPIYFTLGNNDGYDGDYEIPPNGSFLHAGADLFRRYWIKGGSSGSFEGLDEPDPGPRVPGAGSEAEVQGFSDSFVKGGNYGVKPVRTRHASLLAVNSVYFSSQNPYRNQGRQQLEWLERQLKDARDGARKVWILMHILPGIDVRATVPHPGQPTVYWDEAARNPEGRTYLQEFKHLMLKYGSTVRAVFSGHSHMDHFRVVLDADGGKKASAFVHVTPALSPKFKNNAAFQMFRYGRDSMALLDYETHYYHPQYKEWEKEYDFRQTYRRPALTPGSLDKVKEGMLESGYVRSAFIRFYNVNNPKDNPINKTNWKAYWCGIEGLTRGEFASCFPGAEFEGNP